MKRLIIYLLLICISLPLFSKSLITNISVNNGKDSLNDNKFYGSAALGYSKEKFFTLIAAELNQHETTFSLFSRWKVGKQTDTRISQYEELRFRETRDMFSVLSFANIYYYYGISSTYSIGSAISFTFENKGSIRLGTNLVGGVYAKASTINYIDDIIASVSPFALIDLYLSFYDKVHLQAELSTGSMFYLPTNFAYDLTLMTNIAITKALSLGFSIRTGLADNFTETLFSNRYDYSVFINWENEL